MLPTKDDPFDTQTLETSGEVSVIDWQREENLAESVLWKKKKSEM